MKHTLLIFSIIFCFNFSTAQEIVWQKIIGGDNYDWFERIRQTSDGGFIIGGSSTSDISYDKIENAIGDQDYWIVKIDAFGTIQWQNTIGGNTVDLLYDIQQTSDGGYIIGGYSNSNISGDKSENSKGLTDFWVVKLDSLGNIIWDRTIGGSGDDQINSIVVSNDGGYLLGGISNSNVSGDKSENGNGMLDYWIVKINSLGNIQWQNTIGGNKDDRLYTIDKTTDQGYILGGSSFSDSTGDKLETRIGGMDYWIIKVDSLGNINWQNTIGGNNDDFCNSIKQEIDGGFIIGGTSLSDSSGDKTEWRKGNSDFWIIKTNSSGSIIWQKTIGGKGSDGLKMIQKSFDNGYIIGGNSMSDISGDKTEIDYHNGDYWIVKTDSLGKIEWQNTLGGKAADNCYAILQTSDSSYIVGGESHSNMSPEKTSNCYGGYDFWILKISSKINKIKGKAFVDLNSNSVQEPSEPPVVNLTLLETYGNRLTFSRADGSYELNTIDTGNLIVTPASISNFSAVPIQYNVHFLDLELTDSLNDFAFQPNGVINDLFITITPVSRFRPGFNAKYKIRYKNIGTTYLVGTVIFYPDNGISYLTSSVTPNFISTDSIIWQTTSLAPLEEGFISVDVHLDLTIIPGSIVNSLVKIEPVIGDQTPGNNTASWEVVTTSSQDPNELLVDRSSLSTIDLSNSIYLEYIVHFQNTGNDTAFNVKIINPLPIETDPMSFEFLESSHPVTLSYHAPEKTIWFEIDNIQLVDSNVNELLSHGYIRYKIKPLSTLVAGDSIRNKAYIYFDFNAPVATNIAYTEITFPLSVPYYLSNSSFSIYPNPSDGNIKISFVLHRKSDIQLDIFDLFGKKVKTFLNKQNLFGLQEINISTTDLAPGIYYLNFIINGEIITKKIIRI